ncbi:cobalamin biosynthesis protein CbiD [candidate division KSB3 bacterium]|uniref:Cobalt-precorrin-5B C(1)-methyltransferase n=1 Tax=candidate division KSB3 bacterium TaxID=2044937 RepID=A0A2G6E9V8_9BACT|nr:MAG: cobalamin biosynthesis protein CbiD [candidate division KSB3 bacterium]PIE30905.1 MAG: cobalamin biosynthesis protein CbiD [candidate division KSB3 bacterium]
MKHVQYIIERGKKLRCGYTTGTCAAAASKAAALMLLQGADSLKTIALETPAGIPVELKVEQPCLQDDSASCCIVKDAGDDPDVTNGIEIYAEVRKRSDGRIVIEGGKGIGRITRQGFWGAIGEAAINPVPREMIRNELAALAPHGWDVMISAPKGVEIAEHTFNSRLGITGGISIIGTSGIVRPMSDDAVKQTIYLEIDRIAEESRDAILLLLGNYGEQIVTERGWKGPRAQISNFIGDAVAYCYEKRFRKVTLIGHIGKLSKLSIGAFNTHSKMCDIRIEAFVYYLALAGAPADLLQTVLGCVSSEEVLSVIRARGYGGILHDMQQGCVDRLKRYVKDDDFHIDVIFYSMESGILEERV